MNTYIQIVKAIIIFLGVCTFSGTFSVSAADAEETIDSTEVVTTESMQDEWIKVDAVITDIQRKSGRNNGFLSIATVDYTTPDLGEISSTVDIIKIPFYGPLNKVGDTISVSFQQSNPVILHTAIGKIITEYGMYLLILLGVIFAIKPIMQVIKRK